MAEDLSKLEQEHQSQVQSASRAKASETSDSSLASVYTDLRTKGYGPEMFGGAAGLAGIYGAKKYYKNAVQKNLTQIQSALTAEKEAIKALKDAGYEARGVSLGAPQAGYIRGATAEGRAYSQMTADELEAVARDVTKGQKLRFFGTGRLADNALIPKVEIMAPSLTYREARAGETPLGLTSYVQGQTTTAGAPRYIVDASAGKDIKIATEATRKAKEVGGIIDPHSGKIPQGNNPFIGGTRIIGEQGVPVPYKEGLWTRGGRGAVNAWKGYARSDAQTFAQSMKSGLGVGAVIEGGLAAYDTPSIYQSTVDELRRGVDPNGYTELMGMNVPNSVLNDYLAPIGGASNVAIRWGKGAGDALTMGGITIYDLMKSASKTKEEAQKADDLARETDPYGYAKAKQLQENMPFASFDEKLRAMEARTQAEAEQRRNIRELTERTR